MPSSASRRRKAKQANKKITTLTTLPNHHSLPTVQLQGAAVSSNHSKMEGSFNATATATLQQNQEVEESLSEDKEVAVEVAADGKSSSLSESTQDGDSAITDEQATQSEENKELVDSGKVKDTEDVSESVVDSLEPIVSSPNDFSDVTKAAQVDNTLASDTVELELKEEQEKDFLSPEPEDADELSPVVANHRVKGLEETELPPSEDNNELSSVSGNEGLRETEVVETIKDVTVAEEEKNVLSSVVTDRLLRESEEPNEDVASKETLETTIPKSDESDKVGGTEAIPKETEKSGVPSTDEKVGELLDVQESSYESVNESFQPLANVPDAESTSATVQDKAEVPRSTENPTIVSVTQRRQYTSWSSCCGLFEILSRGDR